MDYLPLFLMEFTQIHARDVVVLGKGDFPEPSIRRVEEWSGEFILLGPDFLQRDHFAQEWPERFVIEGMSRPGVQVELIALSLYFYRHKYPTAVIPYGETFNYILGRGWPASLLASQKKG